MVSLVVEVIVLRVRLAHSGTGLSWKESCKSRSLLLQELNDFHVAYYGLPAAGIVSISLLGHCTRKDNLDSIGPKTLPDLDTLCAEVDIEAFVRPEDPNFALISSAIKSIRTLVDLSLRGKLQREAESSEVQAAGTAEQTWSPWDSMEPWDFGSISGINSQTV